MAFDFTNHLGVAGGFSTLVFSTLGVIIPAPAGGAAIYSIYIGLNQIYSISIDQAKAIGIVMFSSNILMIILAGTISYVIMAKRMKA
jgi:phosphate starvation-inducible membrane PsiE